MIMMCLIVNNDSFSVVAELFLSWLRYGIVKGMPKVKQIFFSLSTLQNRNVAQSFIETVSKN
jgi:hypothetical protein